MNIQDWFSNRRGQSLLIPGADEVDRGQCMQAADYALREVYDLPYIWTEGAIDWWNDFDSIPQLKNNFIKITDGTITEGSFVIFNEKVGSKYGHIDLAAADGSSAYFTGYDSNWGGDKTLHEVIHQGAQFVLGSLRFKGEDMIPEGQINDNDDIAELWRFGFFREPSAQELKDNQGLIGKYWSDAIRYLRQTDAFKQVAAQYEAGTGVTLVTEKLYRKG